LGTSPCGQRVLGIALADTLSCALNLIGVGLISVAIAPTPADDSASWLLLGERLRCFTTSGRAVIVGAFITRRARGSPIARAARSSPASCRPSPPLQRWLASCLGRS
jgi:hypothetical protein